MTEQEKIEFFKRKNFRKYIETYNEVERYCSESQTMFCCCGRLATGLHEQNCQEFQKKVEKETLRRLEAEE